MVPVPIGMRHAIISIQEIPESADGKIRPIPRFNPQIHGLRGVSALLVFLYHIYGMASVWGFWPPGWAFLGPGFLVGQYGVEIFFIISGYLITQSLLRHGEVAGFLIDRALRIYPAFLAIHLLVFTVGPLIRWDWMAGITPGRWAIAFAENLALMPGVFPLPLAQKSAWSLSYEAVFYLASSASFASYQGLGSKRMGHMAAILVAGIAILAFVPLYPRSAPFLAGAAAYFVMRDAWRPVPKPLRLLSPVMFVATLVLAGSGNVIRDAPFLTVFPGFLFFISIVEGRCPFSAVLRRRLVQYFGTISYSFYLWAGVISYPIKVAITRLLVGSVGKEWIVLGFTALFLGLTILVSDLSYRFIEVGLARRIRAL